MADTEDLLSPNMAPTITPQDLTSLVLGINQVCATLNTTCKTILDDREVASITANKLAETIHEGHITQREINHQLFDKIGALAESMKSQSAIMSEQTRAISDASKAIELLTREFIAHRTKYEENEKQLRQAEEHVRENINRIDSKAVNAIGHIDELSTKLHELSTRITLIERTEEQRNTFLDNTFTKAFVILTFAASVAFGIAQVVSNGDKDMVEVKQGS